MTFLDAIRGETRATIESPLVPLSSSTIVEFLGGGTTTTSGSSVSEKTSLSLSPVWRAVNLIAGSCASLPLHAYQQANDVRVAAGANTAAVKLLDSPHPDMTPFELWEGAYTHLTLWGNAYFQKLRNQGGQVAELWPIHPSIVRAGRAKDRTKVYVVNGDEDNPVTDDTIFHIPGFGYDGICGLSPIALARQGLGMAMAAEEYGAKLFGNGTLMSGILTMDRQLSQDQASRLKDQWRAKMGGGNRNAHEVAILDNGAKFQQMSIPPEDAQFIESRRFQVAEVARMFGVPPHMLMETDRSTSWGSGIEQQGLGFVVYTLRPWLTRIEQRVSRLLQPGTVYAKYSVEGLLRGDSAARAAFYTQMWNIGAFSTNDIRRLEDRAPVADGDLRFRPLNMAPLGQATDPAPTPTPTEEPTNVAS